MDSVKSAIFSVLLLLDGVIYDFVCYIYEIFYALADINIFSEEAYNEITTKIYVILGLIMLFVLAYSLLKAVINPDDYAKSEQSITKLIPNVIISLVIIVLLPTVFEFAMNFQHAILTNNTIYNLFLDENDIDSETTTIEPGRETAFYTFSAFFYPSEEFCSSDDGGNITDINTCKEKVKSNGGKWYWPPSWGKDTITLDKLDSSILSGEGSFRNYTQFSDAVAENEVSYTFLVSTVAGVFILYVLLNFCFDMAVRVIKLAFYQLIAPIPVICRILPGGKFKETFDTWVKQTVSVYLEVFIRIFVMAISVFLIDLVVTYFNGGELTAQIGNVGFVQKLIIQALLIMAVVIFMKQAPDLIGKMFKLDTGGMKLGLMDKLAMGGGLVAGAAAGGLATTGARNAVAGIRNFKDTKGQGAWTRTKAALGIGTSTIAGVASGAVRSGKAGLKAKNFKDMAGAASTGAAAAVAARSARDARITRYKADGHNAFTGRLSDFGYGIQDWATGGIGQYEDRVKLGQDFKKSGDSIFDEAEKILNKNSNNTDMVATMTEFKGDTIGADGIGAMKKLYDGYSGWSLSQIQEDINRQANIVDFSSYVDRDSFFKDVKNADGTSSRVFDSKEYQAAIEEKAREHSVKMANLRNMYSQLEKETKMKIVNVAVNSDMQIDGIDDSKLQAVRDKVDAFRQQYSQVGSTVVDPAKPKGTPAYGQISQTGDVAKQIDDISTAFANVASEASINATKYRQKNESRKGK